MSGKFRTISSLVIALAIPVTVYLALNRVNIFNKAFGVPADLTVDVSKITETKKSFVWKNISQGGEGDERMLNPVVDNLKKLNLSYVRIDHIYDAYDVVSKDQEGRLQFNWTKLDLTVEDILKTGAIPFFSLSYMPRDLNEDVTGLPGSFGEWQYLVKSTIEHYSGSLGIENVYYEVWNEPDLFGRFKITGGKNYLDLYRHSAIAASQVKGVKPFKIGGPATTGYSSEWTNALFELAQNENLRLDFLSWHRYSNNLSDFESDITNANQHVLEHPGLSGIELIITEAGHDSENDEGYDTNYSALFTIALASTLESRVDRVFSFEAKDGAGPEQYWGRWGILTHEKYGTPIEKPRFRAFTFLNQMTGASLNLLGQGSWVKGFAKKDGDIVKILVVNFDPSGKHFETVPITLTGLTPGDYSLTRTNFTGAKTSKNLIITENQITIVEDFDPNTSAIFEFVPKK